MKIWIIILIIIIDTKKKQKGKNNNKQVSVIKTLKMRKILEKFINKFQLNTITAHVELFTFYLIY